MPTELMEVTLRLTWARAMLINSGNTIGQELKIAIDGTTEDGKPQWFAMLGPNIQEGIVGWGTTEAEAVRSLTEQIIGPDNKLRLVINGKVTGRG